MRPPTHQVVPGDEGFGTAGTHRRTVFGITSALDHPGGCDSMSRTITIYELLSTEYPSVPTRGESTV
jgi:hypothetical protein